MGLKMVERLEKTVLDTLKSLNIKLCTAESMTGGIIAESLIRISGASDVVDSAFVVYTKSSKVDILGVTAKDTFSAECVEQMCNGVKKLRPLCKLCISTSGYAERPKDTSIPFGTYFCIMYKGKYYTSFISCETIRYNRNDMREYVKNYILMSLMDILNIELKQKVTFREFISEQIKSK